MEDLKVRNEKNWREALSDLSIHQFDNCRIVELIATKINTLIY